MKVVGVDTMQFLIISLVTGPKARDMDIILPITLANCLAGTLGALDIACSWHLSTPSLFSGTENSPLSRSTIKPNHSKLLDGVHWDFSMCVINPAYCNSNLTCTLLSEALCYP